MNTLGTIAWIIIFFIMPFIVTVLTFPTTSALEIIDWVMITHIILIGFIGFIGILSILDRWVLPIQPLEYNHGILVDTIDMRVQRTLRRGFGRW
jgi:hypothetical protein